MASMKKKNTRLGNWLGVTAIRADGNLGTSDEKTRDWLSTGNNSAEALGKINSSWKSAKAVGGSRSRMGGGGGRAGMSWEEIE
jgi:hypothetical protein